MITRPVEARIDLAALRHNLESVRIAAPRARVMAVVKANAYGHGAVRVTRVLDAGADAYAVACLGEARTLREAGCTRPITLLSGFLDAGQLHEVARLGLQPVIHHASQLDVIEQVRLPAPLHVWLKIDTGMHRLGLLPDEVPSAAARLALASNVASIDFMTHFACADEDRAPRVPEQVACFDALVRPFGAAASLANSAAILRHPETHRDWVRPGIMLYGVSPFPDSHGVEDGLRPVMTLATRLIAVKSLRRGEHVGYGGGWTCPEDLRLGVAAVGYGDGYPRHAPSGTPVLVNGQRAQLVGRVSMDLVTIDLRDAPGEVGDEVVLWGAGLPVEEVATRAGTIGYELLCGIAGRVPVREIG